MKILKQLIIIIVLLSIGNNQYGQQNKENKHQNFKFAFLTDIHLSVGNNKGFEGFKKAIQSAKSKGIDFIITGGDNVDIDVLGDDDEAAHKLYLQFSEIINEAIIDIYPTVGNHDRFWGCEKDDVLYDEGLFEKYIYKSYYSFNHKGWHFIVLNSTKTCNSAYCVDEVQKKWLEDDLNKVSANTPIIVSVHVPFLSLYSPMTEGKYVTYDVFSNFKEIWDMFEHKNLKLVLQGHQHIYEEIMTKNIQFVTGGAVSAAWWGGPYFGTEEGYLLVKINGTNFSYNYVDFGWEVEKE